MYLPPNKVPLPNNHKRNIGENSKTTRARTSKLNVGYFWFSSPIVSKALAFFFFPMWYENLKIMKLWMWNQKLFYQWIALDSRVQLIFNVTKKYDWSNTFFQPIKLLNARNGDFSSAKGQLHQRMAYFTNHQQKEKEVASLQPKIVRFVRYIPFLMQIADIFFFRLCTLLNR